MTDAERFKQLLRNDLTHALKARQPHVVSAMRSAISAIDNAEAVQLDPDANPARNVDPLGGSFGSGEVPRRTLSSDEIRSILQAEADERTAQAGAYRSLGRQDEAYRLVQEAAAIQGHLDGDDAR